MKANEMWKSRLGIVALFILVTQAVATVSLKLALDAKSEYVGLLVGFIVLYPVLLAVLYFGTLWMRPQVLRAPGADPAGKPGEPTDGGRASAPPGAGRTSGR
jgi:hypothetical protein